MSILSRIYWRMAATAASFSSAPVSLCERFLLGYWLGFLGPSFMPYGFFSTIWLPDELEPLDELAFSSAWSSTSLGCSLSEPDSLLYSSGESLDWTICESLLSIMMFFGSVGGFCCFRLYFLETWKKMCQYFGKSLTYLVFAPYDSFFFVFLTLNFYPSAELLDLRFILDIG